tara:strand:- start:3152 stop:3805 length:654 start_codon:yes stop_codon:yes gene_type:complete
MQPVTSTIYRAFDADGDTLALAPTLAMAKDAIRDSFDTEHQRRDLGTLAVESGGLWSLPFSRCGVEMFAPDFDGKDGFCPRELALALALEELLDDVSPASYGQNRFNAAGGEYLVLTPDEAQRLALQECRESVWAFNADFLAGYMPPGGREALEALRSADRCESANDAVLALLGDNAERAFMDAIACDGLAHYLSDYDSNELSATVDGVTFYIYRTN